MRGKRKGCKTSHQLQWHTSRWKQAKEKSSLHLLYLVLHSCSRDMSLLLCDSSAFTEQHPVADLNVSSSHWGICDEHTSSSCGLCPKSLSHRHLSNMEMAESDPADPLFVATGKRLAALLVTAGPAATLQKPMPRKFKSKAKPEWPRGVVQYKRPFAILLNSKYKLIDFPFPFKSFCCHLLLHSLTGHS